MSSTESSPSSSLDAAGNKRPRKSSEPHRLPPSGEDSSPSIPSASSSLDTLTLLNLMASNGLLSQQARHSQMLLKAAMMSVAVQQNPLVSLQSSLGLLPSLPSPFLPSLPSLPSIPTVDFLSLLNSSQQTEEQRIADEVNVRRNAMSAKRRWNGMEEVERKRSLPANLSREVDVSRAEVDERITLILKEEIFDIMEEEMKEEKESPLILSSLNHSSAFRKVTPGGSNGVEEEAWRSTISSLSPSDSNGSGDLCPPSPLNEKTLSSLSTYLSLHPRVFPSIGHAESFDEFLQRFQLEPTWHGNLAMKTAETSTIWMRLEGEETLAKTIFSSIPNDTVIRVTGKMRMQNDVLQDLLSRMQKEESVCLLVVPAGSTAEQVLASGAVMTSSFVNYFQSKMVAGIAEVHYEGTTYLLHLFPPTEFADNFLSKYPDCSNFLKNKFTNQFLFVVLIRQPLRLA